MILEDFSQAHVHRFDGIGGVDDFADLAWKSKEGNNPLPMVHPGLADGRVLSIPFLSKLHQALLGFCFSKCGVDEPEVSRDRFTVFVGHVGQRIPDHMDNTELHQRFREHRFNGIGKPRQAIHTGNEDVLKSAILKFREHVQLELG